MYESRKGAGEISRSTSLAGPSVLVNAISTKTSCKLSMIHFDFSLPGLYNIGLDLTKPVFGVSDKGRLKPVSSATETS